MGQFAALKTVGKADRAVGAFLSDLLDKEVISAVLVPAQQGHKHVVMQTLVTEPAHLLTAEPFAPVVWTNSAKLVSALTFKPYGRPLAAVLRSCEVRAFVELAKLHQGATDDLLLIGVDCYGRFENLDFMAWAADEPACSQAFLSLASKGGDLATPAGAQLCSACRACEHPVADNVDLRLCAIGAAADEEIWVEAVTDKGQKALEAVGLDTFAEPPAGRAEAVAALTARRVAFRDQQLAECRERTADLDGLSDVLAGCINCYNCRVACPVCYCRECVFVTDTFRHDSEKYLQWAHKDGRLKMPTDTLFYHLTRMVHVSTLCVGCGQCTSACPNDIPLMELFRSVADRTQARFDYLPGRGFDEKQPLAVFHDSEFDDVTGQVK